MPVGSTGLRSCDRVKVYVLSKRFAVNYRMAVLFLGGAITNLRIMIEYLLLFLHFFSLM